MAVAEDDDKVAGDHDGEGDEPGHGDGIGSGDRGVREVLHDEVQRADEEPVAAEENYHAPCQRFYHRRNGGEKATEVHHKQSAGDAHNLVIYSHLPENMLLVMAYQQAYGKQDDSP